MTLLVKPTLACNLSCVYCYEHPVRASRKEYDLEAVKRTMKEQYELTKSPPTIHGGEPTLMPREDFEELLRFSYELCGHSSIQTNLSLVDDEIIDMFVKYKTSVGFSIDGPWPLNELRTDEETTNKIIRNIAKLRGRGVGASPIIVLHRANAVGERLDRLMEWLEEIAEIGVIGGRLNLMENDCPAVREKWELSPEEARICYEKLTPFVIRKGWLWQPFRDVIDNLLGMGLGTCIFGKCDNFCTESALVILGDGSLANSLKSAKNYIYVRDKKPQYQRYEILKAIPRSEGGCGGCRYWRICYGGCPSEGVDGDWRNKTRFCDAFYAMYRKVEDILRGVIPNIYLVPDSRPEDEERDYELRSRRAWDENPFDFTSTWRSEGKPRHRTKKCCSDNSNNNLQPQVKNGFVHHDHADTNGVK